MSYSNLSASSLALARAATGAALSLALACGPLGCAGSNGVPRGFDLHFATNRVDDIAAVAQTAESRGAAPVAPYVVIVGPPPSQGFAAFSLPDGRQTMQTGTAIDTRPFLLGDLVVSHTRGMVYGWDVAHGTERFRLADRGYSLVGADSDGGTLAITLGPGGVSRHQGALVLLDPRTGSIRDQMDAEQSFGTPAVAGGFVFLPWNGQYLTVLEGGRERARILSADDLFTRAMHEGGAVYFGQRALYRFARESGGGRREGAPTYMLPRTDLPGDPPFINDGYFPSPAGLNARERVSVVYRPDPAAAGVGMVNQSVYAVFHRVVFAVNAADGAVKWAYTHDHDIAGAQPVRGGLALVDDTGNAVLLDARAGNPVWRKALSTPAAQAVLQLPLDFSPPHEGAEEPQSAATTLIVAAGGTDTRLLPARVFAARALGTAQGPEATRGLLDLLSRPNYPPEVRAAAGEALSQRTDGTDAMLAALETHYDYLRATAAPPVGYIARALATAHERRAVAPLIAHLQDPETAAQELPALVGALKDFADPSAVPALLDFLRLYHADDGLVPPVSGGEPVNDRTIADQEAISAAMELAVQAVAQLGSPSDKRWLEALGRDVNTLEGTRAALERATAGTTAGTEPTSGGSESGTDADAGAGAVSNPNLPPTRLSPDMIQEAFEPLRDRLMGCLAGSTSRPAQVRIQFFYNTAGRVAGVTVTPPQYAACMAPIAAGVQLPESQVSRELGTYYLLGGPY